MATYLEEIEEKYSDKIQSTSTGMKYIVLQDGSGDKPERGASVVAHYTGKLQDGTKFDSSVDRDEPFEFSVGLGQVISGWDESCLDMSAGEKRIIILPPQLGYGEDGVGPIPADSILIFEVELLSF